MEEVVSNYLEQEFNNKVKNDISIFNFIKKEVLDGIWYLDLENQDNLWMSPKYWEIFGYTPEEKTHTPDAWMNILHPDDIYPIQELTKKHLEDPTIPYDLTVRFYHKDGSIVWIRCRAQAFPNSQGKLTRMIGAHFKTSSLIVKENEIGNLKPTEPNSILHALQSDENSSSTNKVIEQLLSQKQKIGSFVQNLSSQIELQNNIKTRDYLLNYFKENAKDGLLIFNNKLEAIYINEAVGKLIDVKFDTFPVSLASTMKYFQHEDLQSNFIKISNALEEKVDSLKTHHRAISPHKGTVWIESNISFTYDESGNMEHAFVVSRDISRTKNMEKELNHISKKRKEIAQQLIEEREQSKEELYTELHDGINQLLFAASLNIQNSGIENKHLKDSVTKLKKAIEHIRKIAIESTTQFVFNDYFLSAITDYILGFNTSSTKFRINSEIQEPFIISNLSKKHIFRIVQKLVHFSMEESKAKLCVFRFKQIGEDFVIIAVDNGIFNSEAPDLCPDLKSIQDRIYLLEGEMRFFNLADKGLIVYIKIKINE